MEKSSSSSSSPAVTLILDFNPGVKMYLSRATGHTSKHFPGSFGLIRQLGMALSSFSKQTKTTEMPPYVVYSPSPGPEQ
jgi:hypothetical protein